MSAKFILTGNTAKNATTGTLASGKSVGNISIAAQRDYLVDNKPAVDWIPVVAFDKLADINMPFLTRNQSRKVTIEGAIQMQQSKEYTSQAGVVYPPVLQAVFVAKSIVINDLTDEEKLEMAALKTAAYSSPAKENTVSAQEAADKGAEQQAADPQLSNHEREQLAKAGKKAK